MLEAGGCALDAAEAAVRVLEDDDAFDVSAAGRLASPCTRVCACVCGSSAVTFVCIASIRISDVRRLAQDLC